MFIWAISQTILEKQSKFEGGVIEQDDSLTKPQLFINQLISLSEDKQRGIQLTNEEIRDECYIMVAAVS
jgi:cytochrome P450